MSEPDKRRSIRSFVRREGRFTPAQRRALKELWPRYGVDGGDTPIEFTGLFGRQAPVIIEIGFGNGEALSAVAAEHPENNYLGIEVHRPGVGSLLRLLEAGKLSNVRIILADANEALNTQIPDASLTAVRMFFPDPWPKQRHHKRRLVQPDFAALIVRKLAPGGYFHLATDWQDYAGHMAMVLCRTPGLVDIRGSAKCSALVTSRRQTRFEQRGLRLGHAVQDLVFERADEWMAVAR